MSVGLKPGLVRFCQRRRKKGGERKRGREGEGRGRERDENALKAHPRVCQSSSLA